MVRSLLLFAYFSYRLTERRGSNGDVFADCPGHPLRHIKPYPTSHAAGRPRTNSLRTTVQIKPAKVIHNRPSRIRKAKHARTVPSLIPSLHALKRSDDAITRTD